MNDLRGSLRRNFRVLANEAVEELVFMRPSHTVEYIKKQAALLAQRSPEEVNRFLLTSTFKMRERASVSHVISPEELYVVTSDVEGDGSFSCSYMYGGMYYNPPITIPKTEQLRELWEFHMKFHSGYGWTPFQDFVEKKIEEALHALCRYEDMLDMEIVSFEAALMSCEGVLIHNELYRQSVEAYSTFIEIRGFLKKEIAPHCMVVANRDAIKNTAQIIRIIRRAQPRGV